MPYTGQGPEVQLPPLENREWGRFIDVVPTIDFSAGGVDRTTMGGRFMIPGPLGPIVRDFSCNVDDAKVGNITLAEEGTVAFRSFNLLTCSGLSGDMGPTGAWVEKAVDVAISEALAYAATTRLTASSIGLDLDSANLGTAATTVDAVAKVEYGLSERISNARGYVFISLRNLAVAKAAGVVMLIEGRYYTPAGHLVIADAGHHLYETVYGTGPMGYSITETFWPSGRDGELDRSRNTTTWLAEHDGVVVFNPSWSVRTAIGGSAS